MDTSAIYINMCDCEEIQKVWHPKCADFCCIAFPKDRRVVIVSSGSLDIERNPEFIDIVFPYSYGDNSDYKRKDGLIWLPRQDQLQEMVKDKYGLCFDIWVACNEFWHNEPVGYCTSMEQLWLAFVMKEKFNKIWNGEEWV